MILCDAGPLVAMIDAREARHSECLATAKSVLPLVTTWPCLAEAMHFLMRRGGWKAQERLWLMIRTGTLILHSPIDSEVERMHVLMRQYQDLPMDMADASIIAFAESVKIYRLLTLDSHFRIYRTLDGRAMEIIPA